ncbi:PepSY domain-containing protein [Paracoccus pantotrophus]|uniref:PepSY domain-containing protein n=1 Tax=Paracoccus pantotrophus TaxID=82367 RepID=A0A7H9BTM1_PARPN|nr:PepSY-associated TM helix domain-containing protein [Paracoccus pantotrophus]QLH13211.1 PepSY domain-containing protein [Paracoccus pantotrophus]
MGQAEVSVSGFAPQRQVSLQRGQVLVSPQGMQADAEGGFGLAFDPPPDAVAGVAELKVSPRVPPAGASRSTKVAPGLPGRPERAERQGFRRLGPGPAVRGRVRHHQLDAERLEDLAEVSPGDFGIAAGDAKGTVWAANTRQNAVAVFARDALPLVRPFEVGSVEKPRDVVIDAARGRAHVSAHRGRIEACGIKAPEKLDGFELQSVARGGQPGTMSLAPDEKADRLYTLPLRRPELGRIHLGSGAAKILALPGAKASSGVDFDPATGRVVMASQGSDIVIAPEGESGAVLFDTPCLDRAAAGLAALAIFLTGTIACFRVEMRCWMCPERLGPAVGADPVGRALDRLAEVAPAGGKPVPDQRSPAPVLSWAKPGAQAWRRGGKAMATDAATGAPLSPRQTAGGELLYRFHFELCGLPRNMARWILGIATMAMFVAIISGVIAHKKSLKAFFTFRPGKGQRSRQGMHNMATALTLPYHVVIAFSGPVLFAARLTPLVVERPAPRGPAPAALPPRALSPPVLPTPLMAPAAVARSMPVGRIGIEKPAGPGPRSSCSRGVIRR